MRFTKLYEDVKASDLFKPASPEEVAERQEAYPAIKLKELLDSARKTKLPDGTWHAHSYINVSHCKLTTLNGLNISICDNKFNCNDNELTNLVGAPKIVTKSFFCSRNKLTSLEGAPIKVGGYFYCTDNGGIQITKEDISNVCDVKGGISV